MRNILNRLAIVAVVAIVISSCVNYDEGNDIIISGGGVSSQNPTITPSCLIENQSVSRAQNLGYAVRSLIDQVTTKQLDSNFLRIDEDMDPETNDGLYTFTGGDASTPYLTNWNKAYMLEATIISSPDNTQNIHYRSVSLEPAQSYKMKIVETKEGDQVRVDTTHFYHTRMMGWYPKNCVLPRENGVAANAQFDGLAAFDAVRVNETVTINGEQTEVVGLHFKNFDGSTDIMVSNVGEGQWWHKYNATNPHQSDVHPVNGSNIYRFPFGHNFTSPVYSNYFTYKHYRSAVRISAFADQSAQSLTMWGDIQDVIIRNQPTSCKIWLPTELGNNKFGEVYEWNDYKNQHIVRTAMFGDDSNHPEYHEEAKYPISMKGSSSNNDIYLGYSLIEPNRDLEIEVHTASGVYTTVITVEHTHVHENGEVETIHLFQPGYIYHITLDLQTTGTIAAILEKEGDERYYDLSRLKEYKVDTDNGQTNVDVFRIANCYVIDPTNDTKIKDENGNVLTEGGEELTYDGFCFLGTIIGNGQAGIISQGSQKFYPLNEEISPVSAHLLWESKLGLVTNVELKYGYVRFKMPEGVNASGNAVIAVYDAKGNVLWSWHIWITPRPQEVAIQLGSGDHHTIVMLDRNIGATKATCSSEDDALDTYGLYYQWGRKDPSMGPSRYDYNQGNLNSAKYYDYSSDEKTAAEVSQFPRPTLKDAIEHPMYLVLPTEQTMNYSYNWLYERIDFLWGYNAATGMTSKTIYDPCPYGYRVPSSELNHIFTDSSGTGSAGTYGYTRTFGNKSLFFPYAGYKGVDVGMTSVSLPWKYVSEKGDYQSSMYCEGTGSATTLGISHHMHRERIYISEKNQWDEPNIGSYNSFVTTDYANRRTAAPVRCVKDQQIGSINGTISIESGTLVAGEVVTIKYNAHSYGSAIQSAVIEAVYTDTSGVEQRTTLREETFTNVYEFEKTLSYHVPNDINENGVTFRLVVKNEHGLAYSDDVELQKVNVNAVFLQWNVVGNESINNETPGYAIEGQTVRYYVGVLANVKPTSVTINGTTAKEFTEYNSVAQPEGSATSKTVWYIDQACNSKGTINMEASVVVGDATITKSVGAIKVATLTEATTLDTTGNTQYIVEATRTSGYYLTTQNDTLAAGTSWDNYSIITIEGNKIKSVAKNQYFSGTSGNVTFSSTGTEYSITMSGGLVTISSGNNYIRQRSTATNVVLDTNSDGRNWRFYQLTVDMP